MSASLCMQKYVDYIKRKLGGDVIELEITDEQIKDHVQDALEEIRRYIDQSAALITVPFAKCIDLTDFDHSAIINVYRAVGFTGDSTVHTDSTVDPMYVQQWMVFSNGGTTYNLNSYVMNYLSYNTLLQMRNTTSTDLSFREDKSANKLYINTTYDYPELITIEYIPVYRKVEQITSDYWIDILKRLALAQVKIVLGRIRTRFTQTNALWTQDGESLLQEGTQELTELRETLRVNSTYMYPID